jgi:hypothetical protein
MLNVSMLSVVVLSVVAPKLSVAIEPLKGIILNFNFLAFLKVMNA